MLKRFKVFHVLLIGSKPKLNIKVQRGSNNKPKKLKNNSNWEEDNY